MTALPGHVISFGVFEFHDLTRELRKYGQPVKLDPQAAELLAHLLEEPGKLVSYQEIQARLWSDTFVAYGKGIRRCLSQIRGALGDDPKKPVYIETQRNQGCRFVAPVRTASPEGTAPGAEITSDGAKPIQRSALKKYGQYVWVGAPIALAGALAVATLAPAYGLAILFFSLGAVFVCLGYVRFEDTPMARAVVGVYMITAMSYVASASSMPGFQATVINAATLPIAPAFLFVIGLKFIPLFVLVLAFWVILGCRGNEGFLASHGLAKVYVLLGILFLVTESICLSVALGDDRVWKAGLPGRWTLLISSVTLLAVNLTVWLVSLRCFRKESISSYRLLFSVCAIAYLPIALGAFFIDDEHNRINRYYLDVRWPEPYVAGNPDAVKEFGNLLPGNLKSKVGPDLANLLNDAGFNEALQHGKFYKQHSDEAFQVLSRAVMFGYRRQSPSPSGRAPFVTIRFPKELADALRFQLVGNETQAGLETAGLQSR